MLMCDILSRRTYQAAWAYCASETICSQIDSMLQINYTNCYMCMTAIMQYSLFAVIYVVSCVIVLHASCEFVIDRSTIVLML